MTSSQQPWTITKLPKEFRDTHRFDCGQCPKSVEFLRYRQAQEFAENHQYWHLYSTSFTLKPSQLTFTYLPLEKPVAIIWYVNSSWEGKLPKLQLKVDSFNDINIVYFTIDADSLLKIIKPLLEIEETVKIVARVPEHSQPLYKSGPKFVFRTTEDLPKFKPQQRWGTKFIDSPFSPTLEDRILTLRSLAREDWDNQGAEPIPKLLMDITHLFLQHFNYEQEPALTPSTEGEVDIKWAELELSLDIDCFLYTNGTNPTEISHWEEPFNVQKCVQQLLSTFE